MTIWNKQSRTYRNWEKQPIEEVVAEATAACAAKGHDINRWFYDQHVYIGVCSKCDASVEASGMSFGMSRYRGVALEQPCPYVTGRGRWNFENDSHFEDRTERFRK